MGLQPANSSFAIEYVMPEQSTRHPIAPVENL